jgi:hypothetical protein
MAKTGSGTHKKNVMPRTVDFVFSVTEGRATGSGFSGNFSEGEKTVVPTVSDVNLYDNAATK